MSFFQHFFKKALAAILHCLRTRTALILALSAIVFTGFFNLQATAQVSPEDHQAHHPGAPAPSPAPNQPSPAPSGAANPGMMEGMGDMMRQMGVPPPRELYPSLMTLPELSPEKRAEVEASAHDRMASGTDLMTEGLDSLANSLSSNDYEAMQQAIALLHEGMARFDSGLAAHRALVGTNDPRTVALDWFRSEMGLPESPATRRIQGRILGVTWFHFWVMLSSALFVVTLLWLQLLKMRRASRLLRSLTATGLDAGVLPAAQSSAQPDNQQHKRGVNTTTPTTQRWYGQLRVGRIFQETADVKTFRLINPAGGHLPFDYLPGQFMTVMVPSGGQRVRRSYTIASSPSQRDYIELTVKHAPEGVVSSHLHSAVHEGDILEFSGPAGSFVFTGRECKCILLIAGGVGITPLMSVLRYLLDRSWNGDIFLIYGCHNPDDIIFREELDYLQRRHPNLQVVITVSQDGETVWPGPHGRITKELITETVSDLPSRYIHICGPVPMMEATKQLLAELGVPQERIKMEAFGPVLGKEERLPKAAQARTPEGPDSVKTGLPSVTFTDSNKAGSLPPDKVVLDVAEELGVDIDYSCRSGICGVCRVKLLSGEVSMAVEDGLQPGDKESHIILACQASATSDISVKA